MELNGFWGWVVWYAAVLIFVSICTLFEIKKERRS